jgi:hypothetical protein
VIGDHHAVTRLNADFAIGVHLHQLTSSDFNP